MKTGKQAYLEAIRIMLASRGIKETDAANHRALETGLVPLDYFQAAARVLAKAVLK